MVHSKLGQVDEARHWYDKAAAATEKINPAAIQNLDDRENKQMLLKELTELRKEAKMLQQDEAT